MLPAHIIRTDLRNNLFSLTIDQNRKTSDIVMRMLIPTVNTFTIPQTHSLLKKYLPAILKSKCFNQNNYPFDREVRNTEIGHLFEHILLEYLCEQKNLHGVKNPIFNGLTKWDWNRDGRGVFRINVDAGYKDNYVFKPALKKSINLINNIIDKSCTFSKVQDKFAGF